MNRAFCLAAVIAIWLLSLDLRLAGAAESAAKDYLYAKKADIEAWRQLKFGLFVHWGPVSLTGKEIGWSRGGERRGRKDKKTGETAVEVYDDLYKKFNPEKFDARQWVDIAKSAGMRYLVFTTRHHDGFSMFDTKLSDYRITSPESPYRRDIVKQLAEACHEGGLKWGVYYSQPDWHHPDYRTENHARFIQFFHGQVRELMSNYGRVDMLFFDGLGGTADDWDANNLFRMIRGLQPHIIINNRCGLPADNDTPEQKIGKMQTDRPWETCMTICRQWSWRPDDQMKSLTECLQTLIKVVGGDGNLLLNVGPMPDGQIEPRQVERLREMGGWLAKYGESVFGTRGGPFERGPWGASTYKDNKIFIHILDPKLDRVVLPGLRAKIVGGSVLTGGEVTIRQGDRMLDVSVPKANRQEIDTIVVLELEEPVSKARLIRAASLPATLHDHATAGETAR